MRNIFLGTDFFGDCDDAVAIRLLCRAHKRGEINLVGIGINAYAPTSLDAISGMLNIEGVSGIPVGIDLKGNEFKDDLCRYHGGLLPYAKERIPKVDAVKVYRSAIASADGKVDIAEIGFLHVLSDVLDSDGDEISPLNGVELFKQKVNRVWTMAGKWDEDGGREYNVFCHGRSIDGARRLVKSCPVPITFLGFEIGVDVISGSKLDASDPLKRVLADYGTPDGRCSWDPMLAHLAILGDADMAGYSEIMGVAAFDPDGCNHFIPDENGPHGYLIRKFEPQYYADVIDSLIK